MSSAPKRAAKNISEHTVVGARNPFDDAFDARTIVAPRTPSAPRAATPPEEPREETVIAAHAPPPPSPKLPPKIEAKLEPLIMHPAQPAQGSRVTHSQVTHSHTTAESVGVPPMSRPQPAAATRQGLGLPKLSLLVGIVVVLGAMFFYWDGVPSRKKQTRVPTAEESKPVLTPAQIAVRMSPPPRPTSLGDVLQQFDQAYGRTQSAAHASGLQ